jgi:hypothetical protein
MPLCRPNWLFGDLSVALASVLNLSLRDFSGANARALSHGPGATTQFGPLIAMLWQPGTTQAKSMPS